MTRIPFHLHNRRGAIHSPDRLHTIHQLGAIIMRRFHASFFALAALALSAHADEIALVKVGENWSYFKGLAEPSSSTNGWTALEFDDSNWLTSPAGFSAGYGADATQFSDMPLNYTSVYFRKMFTVAQTTDLKWLTLRVDYDDGFVAYLNGREIVRRNLPGLVDSRVPFNAGTTNGHRCGELEEIDVSRFTNLLKTGTNVLAIQAHNARQEDFQFCLIPELLANFNRGPFVQNASSNRIQIIWKTPVPATSQVEFGTNASLGLVVADPGLVTTHALTLTNLLPGTQYHYRVTSSAGAQSARSPIESFSTLKTVGAISFAVFGDSGVGSTAQFDIARVIQSAQPDFVIHVGDITYPSFHTAWSDTRCLSVYRPHMKSTPYFFAIGNHDLYSGPEHFLNAFYLPTNSVSLAEHKFAGTSPKHYYSFDHGDAHFVVLFVPYTSQYTFRAGDAQYRWLTNDLAHSSKPWKFLFFHVSMDTSSAHRFDDNNGNGVLDRLEIRNVVLPVASQFGVQLVFSGHDHGYEKFNPTNGVASIVTGGGGVGLYGLSQLDFSSSLFWVRHNCVKVTIEGDTLETQALGLAGDVFDSMTIHRTAPLAPTYTASWHSPKIEIGPPADNRPNFPGQTFDLRGTPIPSLSGRFSNLGRAFVNNDRTNLFIGLDRVMIQGNDNIFLFVESPRLSGVTNLLGAGNGQIDPKNQGADGLDFLANLSFTNFAPAIGGILGDETADGQFPMFARAGLALDIGQGVYRLNTNLSSVAGVRLQQFNLSPESEAAIGRLDANFIAVAIPLAELGGLRGGDLIKLGAVVGGEVFDSRRQTRLLDTGFVGQRLLNLGSENFALEGITVRLAEDPDPDNDRLTREMELALGTDPDKPDTDGDGLIDGWEVQYRLNPLSAIGDDGANGDPDHDGLTNLQEHRAGTDPRDAGSGLRLQIESLGRGRYRIFWPTVIGKQYQLQIAAQVTGTFTNIVASPATAAEDKLWFDDDVNEHRSVARFFRVRLVAP